ncbi:hypothetical protein ACOMHN_060444 [Nucella lapillus]
MDPRIVALIWVLSCAAVWGQPAIAAGAGQGGDKGSNEFTLISNDGKADRLILATRQAVVGNPQRVLHHFPRPPPGLA